MANLESEHAGLVLVFPADYDVVGNTATISAVIDSVGELNLAALRLVSAGLKRDVLIKRGDALREIAHARDISVVIDDHFALASEIGLDGVHMSTPDLKLIRDAKKAMGNDAIIGVFAGSSRHDGMSAGELGVDYISFGPVSDDGFETPIAGKDNFAWWSEMIEIPLLAEGAITPEALGHIKDVVDFVAIGDEIWSQDDPKAALKALLEVL